MVLSLMGTLESLGEHLKNINAWWLPPDPPEILHPFFSKSPLSDSNVLPGVSATV